MLSIVRLILRSARLSLWPAIILNTGVTSYINSGSFQDSLFLCFSLASIASFGFLINDLKDIPIDRINRSHRLEKATAKELKYITIASVGFLLVSLLLASALAPKGLIAISLIATGLVIYTFYARPKFVWATIIAGIISSSPLWISDVIFLAHPRPMHVALAIVAFILLAGREIVFDVEDIKGDQYGRRRTFATVFGADCALTLSLVLSSLGSLVILALTVATSLRGYPHLTLVNVFGIILLSGLILWPIYKLQNGYREERHFQTYTRNSRVAMVLLPLLWLMF